MNTFSEWHQIAGVFGTTVYIGSYFLVQVGWLKAPGYVYCFSNMVAASLVGISLLFEFNLASALIQISWILISIVGITKLVFFNKHQSRKRRRRRRAVSGQRFYSNDGGINKRLGLVE